MQQTNVERKGEPTMRRVLPLFSLYSFLLLLVGAATGDSMSAYDVLRSYGLPAGLLPKGVRYFSLDDGGRFEARLNAPCTAKFESGVRYNATVSGTISPGEIAGLSGVSAQDLFLWFPVLAIRLDVHAAGIIHFDVGVVDKRYPLSLFEVPPDCAPDSSPPLDVRSRAALLAFQSRLKPRLEDDRGNEAGRVVI